MAISRFLDGLGQAGAGPWTGDGSQLRALKALEQEMLAQQQRKGRLYETRIACCHGSDCPVCKELREKELKAVAAAILERKKKDKAYKKRCEKYMEWYRAKKKELDLCQ